MAESRYRQLTFSSAALLAALVVVGLGLAQHLMGKRVEWLVLAFVFVFVWIGGGFLFQFVLEKFINEKVRIVYQMIQSSKDVSKVRPKTLEDLDRDVREWVKESRSKLAKFEHQETFRREFIGNVSHELKTPIFNIQGYIMSLLDGAVYDEEFNVKYLSRAMKSVERMIDLVEDLEIISRLESEGIKLEKTNFDLIELVREVLDAMEFKAKKKQIKLSFKYADGKSLMVYADRKRMQQVIENLVVNGIKYGNEEGHVTLEFFKLDKDVLVEVVDDGIGIDEASLPRVYERFYRVDKARTIRKSTGSGLGLSIVKHIIEAHGQAIRVRSTVGKGSVFSFTIALAKSGAKAKK